MPLHFKNGTFEKVISDTHYANEKVLEKLLEQHSELLGIDDDEEELAFVCSQFHLDDAGKLDLLFVSNKGLPVIVEIKLGQNAESRREVVAQAIDYLSALSQLDVEQLDKRVGNKLETALRDLAEDDDSTFETLWAAVAGNLRTGSARIVIAVDYAWPDLVRMVRFLAESSGLNVRLVEIQRFGDPNAVEIHVPRIVVDPETEVKPKSGPPQKTIEERLVGSENEAARTFFASHSDMPRNSHHSALAYAEGGKFHWMASPTREGASVLQIDRFDGDEQISAIINQKVGTIYGLI